MTEADALQAEMLLIAKYGRKDNGTGILRNLTDGGEGTSGHVPSEETRKKKAIASKQWVRTPEYCRNLAASKKGKPLSQEHRAKLSLATKGRPFSEEHLAKLRAAMSRRKGFPNPNGSCECNGRAILSQKDVVVIRSGEVNVKVAMARFGISRTQFYRVKRGEQWQQQ